MDLCIERYFRIGESVFSAKAYFRGCGSAHDFIEFGGVEGEDAFEMFDVAAGLVHLFEESMSLVGQELGFPEDFIADDRHLELHLVAGQSPRLISEEVFNLAKLLIDRSRHNFAEAVVLLDVHVFVVGDEVGLEDLNKLKGDNERNGEHCVEEEEIAPKIDETLCDSGVLLIDVEHVRKLGSIECEISQSADGRTDYLEPQKENDELIGFLLNLAAFLPRFFGIPHYFGIHTGINHRPDNPLRISELGASQEQLLWPQEVFLIAKTQSPFEGVKAHVRALGTDFDSFDLVRIVNIVNVEEIDRLLE